MRYIALDVHHRYCEGSELLASGKIKHFRVHTTREGLEQFASQLGPDVHLVMEATGNALWIHDLISPHVGKVLLANPLRTRAIAEARIKTDKLDAEVLVRLLAADFIPEVWVPSPQQRRLRALLEYRTSLVQLRTSLKNMVHAVLVRNGISSPVSDLFGRRGRQFLSSLILPEGEAIVLQSALNSIDTLDKELQALEGELCVQAKARPEVKLLLSVPGLDVVSIMTILAEIGDIQRFSSPKKLASYAGLVPRVYASGKQYYTGHITKEGRSVLRWVLIQVTHRAVQVPGPIQAFFVRLRAKKGYKVAIVAAARKLLTLIWTLLTRGEPYRDADFRRTQLKERRMQRRAIPYPAVQTAVLTRKLEQLLVEETIRPMGEAEGACVLSPMMTAQHRHRLIWALWVLHRLDNALENCKSQFLMRRLGQSRSVKLALA
ncbi:MAG: IS110 family transposase [Bacillota bacterium]